MNRSALALAATMLCGLAAAPASATVILTFGQVTDGHTVTATANGAGTSTTITATDVPITITQIFGGLPTTAEFSLSATSAGIAQALGTGVFQPFDGSFSITSGAGGTGTNYLSGTFTDILLGAGPSAGLVSGAPPDVINFTSGVIPASDLVLPLAISLSFADVTPSVALDGSTLASFVSSVAGDFSANPAAVPEPAALTILGVGLLGLAFARRATLG